MNTVKFLEFIIFTKKIHMNLKRVKTISTWSESQTLKNVQSFLEVSNFYWHFIMHYSKVIELLMNLTGKKASQLFHVTESALKTFTDLKKAFMKSSFLRHFNLIKKCVIETDVSGFMIAAILSQKQEDSHWHLIALSQNSLAIQTIHHIVESRPHLFTKLTYSLERAVLNELR